MGYIASFLVSGTFRRIVAGLVAAALPAVNAWLSKYMEVQIPAEATVGAVLGLAAYLWQSVSNEKNARQVAAVAEAKVTTVDDAVKVLTNAPPAVAPVK